MKKLLMLTTILLSVGLVFGILFVTNNYLTEKNAIAREQLLQTTKQKDRDFVASQKESCLAIYKQESTKWNNTDGWRYDDTNNQCIVQYKNNPPKTKVECDKEYQGSDGKVADLFFHDWLLCQDNLFEKSF